MNPNEIKEKKFDRAAVGGYKVDDVNVFLTSVGDEFDVLSREKEDLEKKLVILAQRLEEYRSDEKSMRSALLGAQKLGDNVIKESSEKAEEIILQARTEARNIIETSKAEAERINGDAKIQLESQTYAINKMKREVSRFKNQMLALYKQHIALIDGLPEEDIKMAEASALRKEQGPPPIPTPITTNMINKAKEPPNGTGEEPDNLKDGFNITD